MRKALLGCLLSASTLVVHAEQVPPVPTAVLETVVVSGAQPGPGLWKISKDDHVLWVLGTLSPLPKRMEWTPRDVERAIASAQRVLLAPRADIDVDGGALTGLFLLPSLLKARNNPDKQTLAEVLPADLYARWEPLKRKYIGRGDSVEKRRPIFAAQELYEEATEDAGLRLNSRVGEVVEKLAKKHDIAVERPTVKVKLAEPRAALREFSRSSVDDIDCLRKTVERLETDLPAMQLRANAWAVGDIEALRALPFVDQNQACRDAMLKNSTVQEHGMGDMRERVAAAWLGAAENTLRDNAVSFAVLPIGQILDDDGMVATLRKRGYEVVAPE
ncbi:MAG TPA: TraB/GumN family protein [Tahibacter sp.]|uniref:TraB/GumN family protein n=1 Tax=Tahibacter sp. TaxID=2056211 RepID=UPI002B76E0BB|nr:TraB/GumN family protein [Tahibacter sp.]HSX59567.1 TraB/GumN family protein [Tahibacter sp.]